MGHRRDRSPAVGGVRPAPDRRRGFAARAGRDPVLGPGIRAAVSTDAGRVHRLHRAHRADRARARSPEAGRSTATRSRWRAGALRHRPARRPVTARGVGEGVTMAGAWVVLVVLSLVEALVLDRL